MDMNKCDFCTQSDQEGKCPWNHAATREKHCKTAIDKMIKVLSDMNKQENGHMSRRIRLH